MPAMAIGGGTGALARIDGGGGGSARLQIDEGVPSGGMRPVDERGKDIGLETSGARFARIAHEFLGEPPSLKLLLAKISEIHFPMCHS